MGPILEPTPAGSALAAALVVAGAPLFSAGLRALKLRRHLLSLDERPLAEAPTGFVLVRGRVALDSPLVGPLSGRPCAGFRLEVRRGATVVARIEERRSFRLVAGDITARVLAGEGAWDVGVVAERPCAPGDSLTENLNALLASAPEAVMLRRAGVALTLVERSLVASHECFVIGQARHARPFELAAEMELACTGTDPVAIPVSSRSWAHEPDLWIAADGHLEFLRVSDRLPEPGGCVMPGWRAVGVVLGPLLSLGGLLYLAHAADRLRAAGVF